jgi:hypothetical protein
VLFCFAGAWLFAADEQAAPAAQNPAEKQTQEAKPQKTDSKLNGRWEAKITRPDGEEMKLIYTFKVEGDKLTGSVQSPRGELEIKDGKVNGDEFSCQLDIGDNVIEYQGKLADNKIKMKSKAPWGEREFALTRLVDINGKWQSKFETPDGEEMVIDFTFKVEGDKLTGTVESPMGEVEITNGKVKGGEFSFDVELGDNTIGHECKISGDEIKMKVKGFPEEREFTLKRAPAK